MRVLLFTGKGGVGKTTVAAATAALAARVGRKALVLSTDPAHSLADALACPLGAEPVEVDPGLYALQVDTQQRFQRSWAEIRGFLLDLLTRGGIDDLRAEELTVLPGADEVLALLEVRDRVSSGAWDLVVVDCAPTAETLRLLALPEALRWYMDRVFPAHRRVVRSLRPVLARLGGGTPVPGDRVFAALERLYGDLAEVQAVLTDPQISSVRLVLTPESVVVAEARRTLTSLRLYGYSVDGVVANRVLSAGGAADGWRAGWAAAHAAGLDEVRASFAGLPVYVAPYLPAEPVGLAALTAFGETVYGPADPAALTPQPPPILLERTEGGYLLGLALPLAERSEVDLARSGDDLVVTVAGHRRLLALPAVLRQHAVSGATLEGGRLCVRFRPDPARCPA